MGASASEWLGRVSDASEVDQKMTPLPQHDFIDPLSHAVLREIHSDRWLRRMDPRLRATKYCVFLSILIENKEKQNILKRLGIVCGGTLNNGPR